MEDHKPTSFTFEIDNFLEKEAVIPSPTFSSGGCQWYAKVYPKGNGIEDHLALYLHVANSGTLLLGWKRRAKYSFVLLNQSGKEIHKTTEFCRVFCGQVCGWGIPMALTLKKFQEKRFLENNKLIVKVQVQVLEVVNEAEVTGNETMDVSGFQVLYSQAIQVSWIFVRNPDIALNFKPKSQLVKITYLNLLLKLIEKLDKPPHSFSKTDLSNIRSKLIDLTEAGFKLDWLNKKVDNISLETKKEDANGTRVQELEEHIKNLKVELNKEKIKSANKVLTLEKKVSELKNKLINEPKSASSRASFFKSVFWFWNKSGTRRR
ncbi:MATH domain and coiled-coil domain-containing protein At2g42470-like [Raphanus sativus]|uniref:MATH domain and coiled-coil domain-containing protein At2g42470-like n=1 Tax=Raphanus sativus TaxID=3726 RepID=A0A6J0LS86_RAPSA|nr:MATH domain and coiled-coil domain-containing protein At2g42470-like [Raphanus sativus]XP_056849668.1 MATH domain and coiled-coil domain-containing protein At2g42470-like [Raphanus sativus]XP_056849669.1 MATH domain and coiled-coil domain-containing protein At2g42470-like [Raphanus sativus]